MTTLRIGTASAKAAVARHLKAAGFEPRLTARRVSFMDLHRVESVIVFVHDWNPSIVPPDFKVPGTRVLYGVNERG